jgi:hypothetical protein
MREIEILWNGKKLGFGSQRDLASSLNDRLKEEDRLC